MALEDTGRVSGILKRPVVLSGKAEFGECSNTKEGEADVLFTKEGNMINGPTYQASGFLQRINVDSVCDDFEEESEDDENPFAHQPVQRRPAPDESRR